MKVSKRNRPSLLLVTNPDNGFPEEDLKVAEGLSGSFNVAIVRPAEATDRLKNADLCLIRNAWPMRDFNADFSRLGEEARRLRKPVYNPFHRTGHIEDKSYLVDLTRQGYPVIPTAFNAAALRKPATGRYVIKPSDGCSSSGVRIINNPPPETPGHIVQPFFELTEEVSYFFIDKRFVYALRTEGDRWEDLRWYEPAEEEIEWAQRFVAWNAMPYGLQRIDAGRTKDGKLWLMEIEDMRPYLSLECLTENQSINVIECLGRSLENMLK